MMKETLNYDATLRDEWVRGDLAESWYAKFPELFDDADRRLALNQNLYHFYEWLAAIHYFERGYLALVEQYIYKPHPRKREIALDILGSKRFEFLGLINKELAQPPDLLVYSRNRLDFFFVEVKGPKDTLKPKQKTAFELIESCFDREITVLELKPGNQERSNRE